MTNTGIAIVDLFLGLLALVWCIGKAVQYREEGGLLPLFFSVAHGLTSAGLFVVAGLLLTSCVLHPEEKKPEPGKVYYVDCRDHLRNYYPDHNPAEIKHNPIQCTTEGLP